MLKDERVLATESHLLNTLQHSDLSAMLCDGCSTAVCRWATGALDTPYLAFDVSSVCAGLICGVLRGKIPIFHTFTEQQWLVFDSPPHPATRDTLPQRTTTHPCAIKRRPCREAPLLISGQHLRASFFTCITLLCFYVLVLSRSICFAFPYSVQCRAVTRRFFGNPFETDVCLCFCSRFAAISLADSGACTSPSVGAAGVFRRIF